MNDTHTATNTISKTMIGVSGCKYAKCILDTASILHMVSCQEYFSEFTTGQGHIRVDSGGHEFRRISAQWRLFLLWMI